MMVASGVTFYTFYGLCRHCVTFYNLLHSTIKSGEVGTNEINDDQAFIGFPTPVTPEIC